METQPSRTTPSSPNPAAHGSPRVRDLSSLRNGDAGTPFRGISRGRGGRGGRGRSGGRLPSTLGGKSHTDSSEGRPSQPEAVSKAEAPSNGKAATPASSSVSTPHKTSDGAPERSGRSKGPSRRSSRSVPPIVIAPPPPVAESSPVTPSRSSNRRRRSQQQNKGSSDRNLKPPSSQASLKPQRTRKSSTQSPVVLRKDIPPHLAAAHDAEIRHDIEALVERVRAVAMAENRPTTPGSHIDWAGDEDDSLPDLDDWGVTTTNTAINREHEEVISPILGDTLKQLPEPHSDAERNMSNDHEMGAFDAQSNEDFSEVSQTPLSATSMHPDMYRTPTSEHSSSHSAADALPVSSSLPKPGAPTCNATVSIDTNDVEVDPPLKSVMEEDSLSTGEGLSESMHAPSSKDLVNMQQPRSSSSERGLSASIHAPVSVPESRSTPNLLSEQPASAKNRPHNRSHGRSHTESRPSQSHRSGRSGASSPLGKHVYTHSRNHSTPPTGGPNQRVHHTSRPVITGEAMSRLARTIGGLGSVPRPQGIPVAKDSTVAS
ncbi:hypothetical protein ID866_1236 [Astraeus odoratus]|nr:hypothetical protein ID866_1236 [Astraeus odoratus]